MTEQSIYFTKEGEAEVIKQYDKALANLGIEYEDNRTYG